MHVDVISRLRQSQLKFVVTISGGGWHPLTEADVFDMECNDWQFRRVVAKVWETLGGKVLNND